MAANLNLKDNGAPNGGRGIDNLSKEPALLSEAQVLIADVDDKVFRGKVQNSVYKSKKLHIDSVPIGGDYPHKIEVQRITGTKNTVAVCIAKSTANVADVKAALFASLGNQHVWSAG